MLPPTLLCPRFDVVQHNVYPFFEPGELGFPVSYPRFALEFLWDWQRALVWGCIQWKGYWPSWIGGLVSVLAIVLTFLMFVRS